MCLLFGHTKKIFTKIYLRRNDFRRDVVNLIADHELIKNQEVFFLKTSKKFKVILNEVRLVLREIILIVAARGAQIVKKSKTPAWSLHILFTFAKIWSKNFLSKIIHFWFIFTFVTNMCLLFGHTEKFLIKYTFVKMKEMLLTWELITNWSKI